MSPSRFLSEIMQEKKTLAAGSAITHEVFGEGFIISLDTEGANPIADVMFRRGGRKRIRADFLNAE
jgi:hypothetical protein